MMIISVECPACHTTFPVDPRKVPDGGVKVRCSVCAGIFFVEKPEVPAAPDPMPAPVAALSATETSGGGPAEAVEPSGTATDPDPEATRSVYGDPPHEEPTSEAVESAWEESAEGSEIDDGAATVEAPPTLAIPATPSEGSSATAPPAEHSDGESVEDSGAEDAIVENFDPDGLDSIDLPESGVVDPWSGSGWEEEAETAPDPWSGGVGLDPSEGTDPAADDRDGVDDPAGAADDLDAVENPTEAPDAPDSGDGWVIEHTHTDGMEPVDAPVERVETVEEETRAAADDLTEEFGTELETSDDWGESAVPPAAEAPVADAIAAPRMPAPDVAPPAAEPAPEPQGFQFGKRDPHDKAKRLARVLVSDIITYNPDRHQLALERGSLHADFEDEIKKSWAEYVEQVGSDIAESTSYWFDALNEILARGEKVF